MLENSLEPEEQPDKPENWRRYLFSATVCLAAVNIIIFLITDITEILTGRNPWLEYGASYWVAFFRGHEYYRPFTSMFLHLDSDHIFNNMVALLFMGTFLEQHIGTRRYVFLYFSCGILADSTSMVYNMLRSADSSSVGASGAIFGIIGGLLAYTILHRGDKDRLSLGQLVFATILSVGFGTRHVDTAAHIGGFIFGFLITLISEKHRSDPAKQLQ